MKLECVTLFQSCFLLDVFSDQHIINILGGLYFSITYSMNKLSHIMTSALLTFPSTAVNFLSEKTVNNLPFFHKPDQMANESF